MNLNDDERKTMVSLQMVAAKGFRDNWNGEGVNCISDRLAFEDMHPANVFIDVVTGKPICIDCIVKFANPLSQSV